MSRQSLTEMLRQISANMEGLAPVAVKKKRDVFSRDVDLGPKVPIPDAPKKKIRRRRVIRSHDGLTQQEKEDKARQDAPNVLSEILFRVKNKAGIKLMCKLLDDNKRVAVTTVRATDLQVIANGHIYPTTIAALLALDMDRDKMIEEVVEQLTDPEKTPKEWRVGS
jgi:hypothetical protein